LAGGAESGVDSGSEGDGVVGAGALEFADGAVRPAAELVENAIAERAGIEDAAVEENGVGDQERGAVDFCGAADGFEKLGGRGDVGFRAGEEAGEVLRDGGVSGVGKAGLAQATGASEGWHFVGGDEREEAVEDDLIDLLAGERGAESRGDETAGAGGDGDGDFLQ
jgi:hypothetical protein